MDYKSAGVNIEAGNQAVDLIKSRVKQTYTPNVFNQLGSFAGGYLFPKDDYDEPVLVSCTDGVGTKVKIACETGKFDTVGIDLVAMSVNDLICMGAKPLFFLDYIACHALKPDEMKTVVDGVVDGCLQAECALIGGEMAEMGDVYQKGEYDLAGFCVGVVDRQKIVDGKGIKPGQKVYGLPSSGIHSNGYSLVRKVLPLDVCEKENISIETLLEPTRIYVKDILELVNQTTVYGIAHITGGGLAENIERILPDTVDLNLKKSAIPSLKIFEDIQRIGQIDEAEMYKVFNMGVGMIVIVDADVTLPEDYHLLGDVAAGTGTVHLG